MYLIIFEDGEIRRTPIVEDDVLQSADDGYCSIINVGPTTPLQYIQGEWQEIAPV